MANPNEIVNDYNAAFAKKDLSKVRSLLHDKFTFKGPLMQLKSPDEFMGMMQQCGFECRLENLQMVSEGERVVQIFDWICTAPFQANLRMSECLTIKDGKIFASELFYDSAKFPKEAMESMSA